MLIPAERALLARYCIGHPVAVCPGCSETLTVTRIGADLLLGRRDFCPACRADLTPVLRRHLAGCTFLGVQIHEAVERARANWQKTQETARSGEQLRDPTPAEAATLTAATDERMIPANGFREPRPPGPA
jgi:hypothetical protein